MTSPSIGVLLVNWNTSGLTADCVATLRAGRRVPDHITVVDNGSAPEDVQNLRTLPGLDLLPQSANLGFTGANNLGLAHLLRQGTDYLWILNNDTLVDPGCLEQLSGVLDREPGVGAVTGRIYFAEPRDQLWYAGGYVRALTRTARHRGIFETDHGQYNQPEDITFACGCCLLVRAEVLRRVGGFHPDYFAYCEDAEWSQRAQRAGIRIRYQPTALLWHRISASLKKNANPSARGFYERLTFRNWLFTLRLHARPWQWPLAGAALLRYAWRRSREARRQGETAVPTAIRQGLREGWRTKLKPATPFNTGLVP